jgi:hypothetical protein
MPVSKTAAGNVKKRKTKGLTIVESMRDGSYVWQTAGKIPVTMQTTLGWEEVDDGVFEVTRPRQADLPEFGRTIESFGFKIKRIEKKPVVGALAISSEEETEGEGKLNKYLTAKDLAAAAKTTSEEARDVLRDWMILNSAPSNPAHSDARVAQIGTHKVHNSWVRGNGTPWDERDHGPISNWAIEEGCANDVVQVILHKTITFDEYAANGIPEGFEGSVSVDPDVYDYYLRIGAFPTEIRDAFEDRGKGHYAVKVYDTQELCCDNCGKTVKKTQKFCGECGAKQNI